jgi:MFS transporter, YQGE family, putative transporter
MKLTGDMKKLLVMCTIATIIFVYINIFVNLYVWDQSHKMFDVAWYNLWVFMIAALANTLATKRLMNKSIRSIIQISAISGAGAFILLLVYHPASQMLGITVYAVPIGITLGSYWGGMNIMLSIFGKGKEFVTFYSYLAIIGQILAMAVPLLSALVIHLSGYFGSFLLMLLFVVFMFTMSFTIPDFSLKQSGELIKIKDIISIEFIVVKEYRSLLIISFFHAVLITFQNLFVLLFTFQVSENEWIIAILNILYSVSSMTALKLFNYNRYIAHNKWLFIGVSLITIGFGCALTHHPIGLILSNICTTFGLFYVNTIIFSGQLAAMERAGVTKKVGLLLWREWVFLIARYIVIGFVLFIDGKETLFYGLIVFVIACSFMIPIRFKKATTQVFNSSEQLPVK